MQQTRLLSFLVQKLGFLKILEKISRICCFSYILVKNGMKWSQKSQYKNLRLKVKKILINMLLYGILVIFLSIFYHQICLKHIPCKIEDIYISYCKKVKLWNSFFLPNFIFLSELFPFTLACSDFFCTFRSTLKFHKYLNQHH